MISMKKLRNTAAGAALLATTGALVTTGTAPASASTLITERTYVMEECGFIKNTNILLQSGDKLVISAAGSIWAGVWFTGRNGPEGWAWAGGGKFPSPSSRPYSLVGKLDGEYVYVGRAFERYILNKSAPGPSEGVLELQTNDDAPCNGDGAFVVTVRVYR
jgi:hypothetical protein